jgi:hypothetical protein
MLSAKNVEAIGEPTVLEENEYRKETVLIPILVHPDRFVANILNCLNTEKRANVQARLTRNALYFSALFPEKHVLPEIVDMRQRLNQEAA